MRQLSRRNPRRGGRARNSVTSDAAILSHDGDQKSVQLNGGRSRSMSGSSAILLNRPGASDGRRSVGLDSISVPSGGHGETGSAPYTPTISGGASAFSYIPGSSQTAGHGGSPRLGIVNLKSAEAADPYYRPPRARRRTVDAYSPGTRSRGSWTSADWANKRWSHHSPEQEGSPDPMEGPSLSGRATPIPAHLGTARERSDSNIEDPRLSKTDYAIREVDFYYNIRGPALSNQPTRRLKTGPADPTGPVSSATGWVKSLFGGKTKDKGKGFEVLRSSRAPQIAPPRVSRAVDPSDEVPYTDDPGVATLERTLDRDLDLSDEGDAIGGGTRHLPEEGATSPPTSEDEYESDFDGGYLSTNRASQISQFPPSLPNIDTGGGIELPSRIASRASSRPSRHSTRKTEGGPTLPRKSSRRMSSQGKGDLTQNESSRLSAITASPPPTPQHPGRLYNADHASRHFLKPSIGISNRLPFESEMSPSMSNRLSTGAESTNSSMLIPIGDDHSKHEAGHARHSSSVLGSLAPDIRQDRPSSMGYVQQHRASDNIHTASPDENSFLGSSAELVDDPSRRSVSPDARRLDRR